MNTVGKIFVVLILVASLAILSFALAVTAPHPDWRAMAERPRSEAKLGLSLGLKYQLEEAKSIQEQLAAEISNLQAELKRIDDTSPESPYRIRIQQLEVENGDLQVDNDRTRKELEQRASEARLDTARVKVAQHQLSQNVDEIKRLLPELRKKEQIRDTQLASYVVRQDEANQQTDRIAQVDRLVRRSAERVSELRTMLVEHEIDPDASTSGAGPRVNGVITSLGKNLLIEISIGSDDGLSRGQTVEIYRGKKYLGRAEVLRTEADKSVARLLRDFRKAPLRKGDRVATRLKIS